MYRLYLKTGNCYLAKYIMNDISKNKNMFFVVCSVQPKALLN